MSMYSMRHPEQFDGRDSGNANDHPLGLSTGRTPLSPYAGLTMQEIVDMLAAPIYHKAFCQGCHLCSPKKAVVDIDLSQIERRVCALLSPQATKHLVDGTTPPSAAPGEVM